jgi:hypothetical protein
MSKNSIPGCVEQMLFEKLSSDAQKKTMSSKKQPKNRLIGEVAMKCLNAHQLQNLVLMGWGGGGDDTSPTPSSFLNWLINIASLLHGI